LYKTVHIGGKAYFRVAIGNGRVDVRRDAVLSIGGCNALFRGPARKARPRLIGNGAAIRPAAGGSGRLYGSE